MDKQVLVETWKVRADFVTRGEFPGAGGMVVKCPTPYLYIHCILRPHVMFNVVELRCVFILVSYKTKKSLNEVLNGCFVAAIM